MHLTRTNNWDQSAVRCKGQLWKVTRSEAIDNKKHLMYSFWMKQLVELFDHKQDMVLFVCGWDGEFGILYSVHKFLAQDWNFFLVWKFTQYTKNNTDFTPLKTTTNNTLQEYKVQQSFTFILAFTLINMLHFALIVHLFFLAVTKIEFKMLFLQ